MDNDLNDDEEDVDHCVACYSGANQARGEIIRACDCRAEHLGYHFACLVQWIKSSGDVPCAVCGKRFDRSPRIRRFQYSYWQVFLRSIHVGYVLQLLFLLGLEAFFYRQLRDTPPDIRYPVLILVLFLTILCLYLMLERFWLGVQRFAGSYYIQFTHFTPNGNSFVEDYDFDD